MASGNRRIKISQTSSISSDHFYQKITNYNTGTAKVINKPDPEHWTKTATAIGNPSDPEKYGSQTKSRNEPVVEEVKSKRQEPEQVKGFDTSQL